MRPHLRAVHAYTSVVTLVAIALALSFVARGGAFTVPWGSYAFWFFAICVVVSEFFPIQVRWRGSDGTVTLTTTFAFALLLLVGAPTAALVMGLGSAASDAHGRRAWWKVAFNVAQYTLSLAMGGLVLSSMTSGDVLAGPVSVYDMLALLLASAALLLTNYLLTGVAIALAAELPLLATLRQDLAFNNAIPGVLLLLAPALVVLAEHAPPLIGPLILTVAAFYQGAKVTQQREHASLHDPLTGLPNRRMFTDRVSEAIADAAATAGHAVVLLIDLNRFKQINDTMGHHVGDLVLQHVATQIVDALPDNCTVARLGGDEFAVLLPRLASEAEAEDLARVVVHAIEQPLVVEGCPLSVGGSVGIAVAPRDGSDPPSLLERADVAMFAAKRAGTGSESYRADRDDGQRSRLELLGQLQRAVDGGQLELHYQPLAHVATRRVVGVEALLRWHHPEHGMLTPDEFLPLAEGTEIMAPITRFVLQTALRQGAAWHRLGFPLTISVNLAVQDLSDPSLAGDLRQLLRNVALEPAWLKLELHEATNLDPRVRSVLDDLAALGVRLALDDFGSGRASLVHLREMPADELKIAPSLVAEVTSDPEAAHIVSAVIALAAQLGRQVVAEGVETERTWRWLADHGCDLAQGYWLSHPLPASALLLWLEHRLPPLAERAAQRS